jgi:hypothetical protein
MEDDTGTYNFNKLDIINSLAINGATLAVYMILEMTAILSNVGLVSIAGSVHLQSFQKFCNSWVLLLLLVPRCPPVAKAV